MEDIEGDTVDDHEKGTWAGWIHHAELNGESLVASKD